MIYRKLGKTNLKVSTIGIGTWQFGGEWGLTYTQEDVDGILDQAQAVGINFIDTAECYGDHLSESLIGGYLQKRKREDWVVATKFGHHFHGFYDRTTHWSPEDVLQQLEGSLKALQTDYIDVYQFHSGTDEVFDNDDLWTMLDKQVQAGKIKHLGISLKANSETYQTSQAEKVGAKVIQVVYNRLDRSPEKDIFPLCESNDLGVMARVPLASGLLSGKYKPGSTFAKNDVRSVKDQAELQQKMVEAAQIQQFEVPETMDMSTWALAWCLKHDAVTSVIPGCKNKEQVIANAKAAQYANENHPQAWDKDEA
ncbi:aldo/keto reductase [Longirhabdus pacifica]|uniref:aldo/keto reductase n=1 Tax=Longirhabdus pacifica TaxID=2305227 RepID=UPI0010089C02|nr:aldo/keto reductase [Longirhabdus pacifica]